MAGNGEPIPSPAANRAYNSVISEFAGKKKGKNAMNSAHKPAALILALALSLGLAACGGNSTSSSLSAPAAPAEPATLVYGSGDYTSINPIMNEHCEIRDLLFDGLMARDGAGNLLPALAESCLLYTSRCV